MSRKTATKKRSAAKKAAEAAPDEQPSGAALSVSDYCRRKRKFGYLDLGEGIRFIVKRPSPEIGLRYQRLPSNLRQKLEEGTGQTKDSVFQTDEEVRAFMGYARALVMDVCVAPRVAEKPTNGEALDIDANLDPTHFWKLFNWGERGGETLPLETEGGGAVTIEDLEKFRSESGVSSVVSDGGRETGPGALAASTSQDL